MMNEKFPIDDLWVNYNYCDKTQMPTFSSFYFLLKAGIGLLYVTVKWRMSVALSHLAKVTHVWLFLDAHNSPQSQVVCTCCQFPFIDWAIDVTYIQVELLDKSDNKWFDRSLAPKWELDS